MLWKQEWSRQVVYYISLICSKTLCEGWRQDMRWFTADNLVFLDKSIFNKKTGWRHWGWGPISEEIQYKADVRRGPTWSILAAMGLDGYLPCTGIQEGYFKREEFLYWLFNNLLPALTEKYGHCTLVIILDNNSVHID